VGRLPSLDSEGKTLTADTSEIALVPDEASLAKALPNAAPPDFKVTGNDAAKSQLGFIRRKLPDADIYFVTNTSNQPVNTTATFQTKYLTGNQLDPDTAESLVVPSSDLNLNLWPYESRVFIFSNDAGKPNPEFIKSNEFRNKLNSPGPHAISVLSTPPMDLTNDWQLKFASTNKAESQSLPSDWTANPATLHYSGEAIYSRDFDLQSPPSTPIYLQIEGGTANNPNPPITQQAEHNTPGIPNPLVTRTGPGMHAWYDPPVREAAIVFINGQRAGSLWHPPYSLDVSKLLKPGSNHIEIHVYNTALNAWSALPPHDYKPLIEKYGDRFQMQDLDKVQPVPSGILGQIHLVTEAP
jgi:hypothetical protein